MDLIYLIVSVVIAGIAFALGWVLNSKIGSGGIERAKEESARILKDAENEARNLKKEKLLEVKDEWLKKKQEFDNEVNNRRQKLNNIEKQLEKRESGVERKMEIIAEKERELDELADQIKIKQEQIANKSERLDNILKEQNKRLEKIAQLTTEEAKNMLIENLKDRAKTEAQQFIRDIRDQAKVDAKKEARKIVINAIQKTAVDHSVETTVSVVQIQSDEMKGRIIGREGRNIRAFEAATGIDVIVDDTPEAVILSGFDQYRREIARIALERLISDGRIHPARIEEVVTKVKEELEDEIYKEGENVVIQLSLHGVHPELVRSIGKMKYRSSYGQNLLQHSIEVAYLAGFMAAELGLDIKMAKRAGLLHDIGKTLDKSIEGPHALLGYEMAKKYKEHPIIVNAIGSHHDDIEMTSPYAPLVQAADAISGARPGARRESLESYIKRLENLESIANSFDGVAKTYAIQAGREIRVVVEPDKIDDEYSDQLAYDIAQRIQQDLEYPGQIKVTVIREVRKIAFAK